MIDRYDYALTTDSLVRRQLRIKYLLPHTDELFDQLGGSINVILYDTMDIDVKLEIWSILEECVRKSFYYGDE